MRKSAAPYLLILLAWTAVTIPALANAKSLENWRSLQFVHNCRIMDSDGNTLKSFPGRLCLFLDDGKFVISTPRELSLYDHQQRKLWSMKGHFHHQLNLSADGKSILTISSLFEKRGTEIARYDRLLRIGLDGRILNDQSFEALYEDSKFVSSGVQLERNPFDWEPDLEQRADYEIGHANSIREIPKQNVPKKQRLFDEGQVVVNSLGIGIFVLTPDFKRVIYFTRLKESASHTIHDVEALSDGTFLYFNNVNSDPKRPHSSIDIYDPRSSKRVFKFAPKPEEFFLSYTCGSVQLLDEDTILFSDRYKGAFIISRNERKLVRAIPEMSLARSRPNGPPVPLTTVQIRAWNLRPFLEYWR